MSIDSISSPVGRADHHRIRQDLGALKSDLQSGNLSQAQTDFATLLDDAPGLKNELASGTAAASSSSQASALGSLSSALQAGDVTGASTALTSLQQTLGAMHHHHHRHDHDDAVAGATGSANASMLQTDVQSLAGALQTGNLSAAQTAFAQLQKDDPNVANALAQAAGATPTTGATNTLG